MATITAPTETLDQNTALGSQFSIPSTSEGRRQDLMNKVKDLEGINQTVTERSKIDETRLQSTKTRLIQALFRMMKDLGVDPTSLESINEFLQALDKQDPDLRELFEVSFNTLISDRDVNPQAPAPANEAGAGMFGRPESLADQTFRSR